MAGAPKFARAASVADQQKSSRVLFYIDKRREWYTHGFITKSRETPAADLALARANKRTHEGSLT